MAAMIMLLQRKGPPKIVELFYKVIDEYLRNQGLKVLDTLPLNGGRN